MFRNKNSVTNKAKPASHKFMNTIRVKLTVNLTRNHVLTDEMLESLKPLLARAIAGALPDSMSVDTISVTSIKEVTQHSEALR